MALISTITGGMSESSGCRRGGVRRGPMRWGNGGAVWRARGGVAARDLALLHCFAGLGVLSREKGNQRGCSHFAHAIPRPAHAPAPPLSCGSDRPGCSASLEMRAAPVPHATTPTRHVEAPASQCSAAQPYAHASSQNGDEPDTHRHTQMAVFGILTATACALRVRWR